MGQWREMTVRERERVADLHHAIYELFNRLDAGPGEGLLACLTSAAFAARFPPEGLPPLSCRDFIMTCKDAYRRVCSIKGRTN